jgi:hypothetical protein
VDRVALSALKLLTWLVWSARRTAGPGCAAARHAGPAGRQVMLRVTDLDASIQYYTECLGCTLLRKKDNPEYKYTLAFLGYGPEDANCVFELTYNWCGLCMRSPLVAHVRCVSSPSTCILMPRAGPAWQCLDDNTNISACRSGHVQLCCARRV